MVVYVLHPICTLIKLLVYYFQIETDQ